MSDLTLTVSMANRYYKLEITAPPHNKGRFQYWNGIKIFETRAVKELGVLSGSFKSCEWGLFRVDPITNEYGIITGGTAEKIEHEGTLALLLKKSTELAFVYQQEAEKATHLENIAQQLAAQVSIKKMKVELSLVSDDGICMEATSLQKEGIQKLEDLAQEIHANLNRAVSARKFYCERAIKMSNFNELLTYFCQLDKAQDLLKSPPQSPMDAPFLKNSLPELSDQA